MKTALLASAFATLLLLPTILGGCSPQSSDWFNAPPRAIITDNQSNPAKTASNARLNAVATDAASAVWQFALSAGQGYVASKIGDQAAATIFDQAKRISTPGQMRAVLTGTSPQLATAAATAFASAGPTTAAEKSTVANSIGAALQAAADSKSGIFDNQP